MNSLLEQRGFSSKSILLFLIIIGGFSVGVTTIIDGEFLLKGTWIVRKDNPFYFWSLILCFFGGVTYAVRLFVASIKHK